MVLTNPYKTKPRRQQPPEANQQRVGLDANPNTTSGTNHENNFGPLAADRSCMKRPHRPWDTTEPVTNNNIKDTTTTTTTTTTAESTKAMTSAPLKFGSKSRHHNPYAKATKGVVPKSSTLPSATGTTTTIKSVDVPKSSEESFDFDNDGIDWMAAVDCVDAVTQQSQQQKQTSQPCTAQSSTKENRSNVTNNNGFTSSVTSSSNTRPDHQQKLNLNGNNSLPLATATHSSSNKTASGVPPGQKTLESLRPESWLSKNNQTNDERLRQQSNVLPCREQISGAGGTNTGDPLQEGLPRELCFHPKCIEPVDDGNYKTLVAHANLASPLRNGWELFPHQVQAIKQSLAMRRFILALDMGLGKTLIGCVWISSFLQTSLLQCKRAYILCPVSLQNEWKRTAEEAAGLEVQLGAEKKKAASTKTAKPNNKKKGKETVVAASSSEDDSNDDDNDDDGDIRKRKTPSSSSAAPVSIHSWSKVPSPPAEGNFIVVADEAHSIQSMQAARTQSTLALVLHRRCIGVLLLSGTPMKNGKPSNLFPLLRAVRHPLGRNQRAYETRFCEGRQVYFGKSRPTWQATGSANLEQLRALTKSHLLYLSKDDCLKALPKKERVIENVPVSSRGRLQHDKAIQELLNVYQSSKGRNTEGGDPVLGAFQTLRLIGSMTKVDATVQYAKKILEEEPAVVIFTCFQEPARLVHQKLADSGWNGELLTGETPSMKRQAMVDNFQNGLSPVFVCTFGAGGVGLTLTAARTIILLDRPWTPGDAFQAEDRVRRIGQKFAVKSIWMRSLEMDEKIDDMIDHKSQTSSAVLTEAGDGENNNDTKQQKVSIYKLLDGIVQEKKNHWKQTSILQFSQQSE